MRFPGLHNRFPLLANARLDARVCDVAYCASETTRNTAALTYWFRTFGSGMVVFDASS